MQLRATLVIPSTCLMPGLRTAGLGKASSTRKRRVNRRTRNHFCLAENENDVLISARRRKMRGREKERDEVAEWDGA